MEKKNIKAKFIYRLIAFIVDIMFVYFITTLVSYPFIASKADNLEKISNQASEVVEQFGAGEITMNGYINETASLSFESAKIQGISILITSVFRVTNLRCRISLMPMFSLSWTGTASPDKSTVRTPSVFFLKHIILPP